MGVPDADPAVRAVTFDGKHRGWADGLFLRKTHLVPALIGLGSQWGVVRRPRPNSGEAAIAGLYVYETGPMLASLPRDESAWI